MGATRIAIYWCRAWVDGGAIIHLSKGEEVGEDRVCRLSHWREELKLRLGWKSAAGSRSQWRVELAQEDRQSVDREPGTGPLGL